MSATVVSLRRIPQPSPSARQLADRLLLWHASLSAELDRNDQTSDDFKRRADAQAECAMRCAEEALDWLKRDTETYLALMGCAARYILTARVFLTRAEELLG